MVWLILGIVILILLIAFCIQWYRQPKCTTCKSRDLYGFSFDEEYSTHMWCGKCNSIMEITYKQM